MVEETDLVFYLILACEEEKVTFAEALGLIAHYYWMSLTYALECTSINLSSEFSSGQKIYNTYNETHLETE